jgi:hypothetical protein
MVAIAGFRVARMATGLLMLVLVAAAVAVLAPRADADAHRASYSTSSSFGYASGTTIVPDAFLGQVSSPESACVKRRKAVVFRKRRGRDARIGADRTSSTGQWIVEKRRVRRGKYYLKVPAKRLRNGGHHHTCERYRSSTLPMGG